VTFQPVIPLSGYTGWRFLQRTLDAQTAAFVDSPVIERATAAFRDRIATVRTADDLIADRPLLTVALGAFGLDDDIGNTAFLRRILNDGTTADGALANRLSDKRYAQFSAAFGFGDAGARTALGGFADGIVERFERRQFQRAVGAQDDSMRLALNVAEELGALADRPGRDDSKWFAIMGSPPLRSVFETALGLPPSFGRIDIDQQRDAFRDRARTTFGTEKVSDFADPDMQERLIRLFLIRSDAGAAATNGSGASIALSLLRGSAA